MVPHPLRKPLTSPFEEDRWTISRRAVIRPLRPECVDLCAGNSVAIMVVLATHRKARSWIDGRAGRKVGIVCMRGSDPTPIGMAYVLASVDLVTFLHARERAGVKERRYAAIIVQDVDKITTTARVAYRLEDRSVLRRKDWFARPVSKISARMKVTHHPAVIVLVRAIAERSSHDNRLIAGIRTHWPGYSILVGIVWMGCLRAEEDGLIAFANSIVDQLPTQHLVRWRFRSLGDAGPKVGKLFLLSE